MKRGDFILACWLLALTGGVLVGSMLQPGNQSVPGTIGIALAILGLGSGLVGVGARR